MKGGIVSRCALVNARILDCTGREPYEGSLLIENSRIQDISGKSGVITLSDDVQVLDCAGKTLLPGLIDCHVHMGSVEVGIAEQMRRLFPSYTTVKTLNNMKQTLEQGFTSIRDAGGIDHGYKQALQEKLIVGPRLFISGRILSQTGGHADWRLPSEFHPPQEHAAGFCSTVCDGLDAVRKTTRENIRQGVDFIKIMAGGGAMSPADEIDTAQYSLEEIAGIVFEAENAGTYVAGHCYSDRSILNCLQAGVRTIEHGNLMTRSSAQAIQQAGAYLVPTMITYHMLSRYGRDFGIPDYNIAKIDQALEKAASSLELALQENCKIGSGSDLLGPLQIHKAGEIRLQAEIMGPMQALMAATKINAEIVRQEKHLGTIEVGKLADLILIDGDPLEDIGILEDYQTKIQLIMQDGRVYKNDL